MAVWPAEFDSIIRARSRFVTAGQDIDPEATLAALGVDSLELVELIVSLENEFDLEIPQDRLTPETFASAGSIWRMLCDVRPALAAAAVD